MFSVFNQSIDDCSEAATWWGHWDRESKFKFKFKNLSFLPRFKIHLISFLPEKVLYYEFEYMQHQT